MIIDNEEFISARAGLLGCASEPPHFFFEMRILSHTQDIKKYIYRHRNKNMFSLILQIILLQSWLSASDPVSGYGSEGSLQSSASHRDTLLGVRKFRNSMCQVTG